MEFKHFSKNGTLMPIAEALVALSNIEYQYGFGVYETVRVAHGIAYFLKDHVERLEESARIIGLEHLFASGFVERAVRNLQTSLQAESYNLKILLIGAQSKEKALLYVLPLNPLFPDRRFYSEGVKCISYRYERNFPHAKSLNMLGSYIAYRKASHSGAYDALLINGAGQLTEGTRTNFFAIKDKTTFSPPQEKILLGVTRKALLLCAARAGYALLEKDMTLDELNSYDNLFLTSTSSKILPIRAIDDQEYKAPTSALFNLMALFDRFLDDSKGVLA